MSSQNKACLGGFLLSRMPVFHLIASWVLLSCFLAVDSLKSPSRLLFDRADVQSAFDNVAVQIREKLPISAIDAELGELIASSARKSSSLDMTTTTARRQRQLTKDALFSTLRQLQPKEKLEKFRKNQASYTLAILDQLQPKEKLAGLKRSLSDSSATSLQAELLSYIAVILLGGSMSVLSASSGPLAGVVLTEALFFSYCFAITKKLGDPDAALNKSDNKSTRDWDFIWRLEQLMN